MYNWFQYYLLGMLAIILLPSSSWAQVVPQHYFFDGDEVVFEFDGRQYLKAREKGILETLDFSDYKIDEVVISGNFNEWSKDAWKMKKVGPFKYQLRKKIKDFNDPFTWEFKFLVNGQYWVVPEEDKPDKKILSNDFIEEAFDLKLKHVEPDSNGNIQFELMGYKNAQRVVLAGTFNNWNERALNLDPTDKGWAVSINLAPGRYEYKFIVDGQWMHDPANSEKVRNEHHTFNSVLWIDKEVKFELAGFPEAQSVILAGSFNHWDQQAIKMEKVPGGWIKELELHPGKHYYKFIVDGNWMIDPSNPLHEKDRDGNENSVLIIR